jgi:enoyl-CoA hydratase/carnithine racemase
VSDTQQDTSSQPESAESMVLYEIVEPHIAKVTLNRPHRRNAMLTPQMNEELEARLREAEDDDSIKVIILAGSGTHFCSGEDVTRTPVESFGLKRGEKLPQSPRIHGIARHSAMLRLRNWDKTIIASVQGGAYGFGFSLVINCDLIIAAEGAKFSRPQSRIGFAGFDMMLPVFLLKLGINRGYEVLITGRRVSAEDLYDWGVVNSVVPESDLAAETLRYARAVAAHSTDGLMIGRQAKKVFWEMVGMSQWDAFVNVAHPLFTNLVWRSDESNLLKERANASSPKEALLQVYRRWQELGFD